MGSLAGPRPYLCLVRAPARPITALGTDHAGRKRTHAYDRSSEMGSPYVTAIKAFTLEPPGGDPTIRSAIAVADPLPR